MCEHEQLVLCSESRLAMWEYEQCSVQGILGSMCTVMLHDYKVYILVHQFKVMESG